MDLRLQLPDEIVEALGPEPERGALEGVVLLLVSEGKLTLEQTAAILGFNGREEAMRWYTGHTLSGSGPVNPGEVAGSETPVHLEDLTQEELDRSERFLNITPAKKGSGLSDVSVNHDKYLFQDT